MPDSAKKVGIDQSMSIDDRGVEARTSPILPIHLANGQPTDFDFYGKYVRYNEDQTQQYMRSR